MTFMLHTRETAPAASADMLDDVAATYGFVPNLYRVLAASPVALATYSGILAALKAGAALTPQEQQLVMLRVSVRNRCEYCVAAHSTVAMGAKVPAETVAALRADGLPTDPTQAALIRFVDRLMEAQGWASEQDQQAFLDAGYTHRHLLDVVSILALKTLSNYTNHMAHTPVDPEFARLAWSAAA